MPEDINDNQSDVEAEVDKIMEGHENEAADSTKASSEAGPDPSPDDTSSAPELSSSEVDQSITTESANDSDKEESSENLVNLDETNSNVSELDDDETGEAIKDINRQDSDELLEAEDGKSTFRNEPIKPKKSNIFKRWWRSKPWRYTTILVILALIAAALIVPKSRFFILNHLGQRSAVTVKIIDSSADLPLGQASVSLDGQTKTSTEDGLARFTNVKLGKQTITVRKPAFASATKQIIVKLGTNRVGAINLKAVGVQYSFKLTDYLTGKPIIGANLSIGKSTSPTNTDGVAVITLASPAKKNQTAKVKASGYNSKTKLKFTNKKTTEVKLVPAGKDYYIYDDSGNYNLYSSNLDGSSRELLLKASGDEGSHQQLVANQTGSLLALVNTRGGQHDGNDNLLQTLTIVSTKTKQTLTLDEANSIKLIGWLDGDTLVYVSSDGCSGTKCVQLESYNYDKSASQELAHASGFSYVEAIRNRIYYVTSTNYDKKDYHSQFVAVNSDGTDRNVILKKTIYSVYRSKYDELQLAALGDWYSYQLGQSKAHKIKAPNHPSFSQYVDSPDNQKAAWIDKRNGQPVLLVYDRSADKNKTITSLAGLSYPIRWLNSNTLIYRLDSSSQTADYVISLDGGKPHKIANVTDASAEGYID